MRNSMSAFALRHLPAQYRSSCVRGRLLIAQLALVCLALVLGVCPPSQAQTATGQFNGHVYDANGAVVAGATVLLAEPQTGLSRTAVTNGEGLYQFPLIPPGNYILSASASGFQKATKPAIRLDVNQISTQDFKLQVGAATQTVTVNATAEQLQASTANLGSVVEQETVGTLPLNGRSFSALLTLVPGENPVNYSQNGNVGYGTGFGSPGIPGSTYTFPATQGQWNRENLYYLDGIINTAAFASSYDVPPIIDSIQEFKIQSHNDEAEYGSVTGGVVNVVTKSGTNAYHGAMWEYVRNNDFDSRNPFTDFKNGTPSAPAPFRQNEYGVQAGGPVRIPHVYNGRDKTFFTAAWEAWKYSKAAGASYISPTPDELNGDFTNSSIITSTGLPPLLYDPFSTTGSAGNYTRQLLGDGHVIPSGMIDKGVQNFLKAYSDPPNFTPKFPGGPNTILNAVGTNNANAFTVRVDQNFGSNNTLWGRYSFIDGSSIAPSSLKASGLSSSNNRNMGGGYVHVFSPRLILDAAIGYSGRFQSENTSTFTNVPADGNALFSGIASVYGYQNFGYTATSSSAQTGLTEGYNGIGGSGPSVNQSQEVSFSVNMTWIHGNHQFRYGYEQTIMGMEQGIGGKDFGGATFTFASQETADPNNQGATGNPLASALIGVPDNGRFQSEINGVHTYNPSLYFEDSWKVTPRLTLNLGLRWDGSSSPHLAPGTTADLLDPNTGNWIVSGGKLPPPCNPAAGVYAPCMPTLSSDPALTPAEAAINAAHVTVASNPNLGPDPIYTNFGPRIGFAYQIRPNTVIRGGYGWLYDNAIGTIQTVRDRLLSWPSNSSLPLDFNTTEPGAQVATMDAQNAIVPTLSSIKALPSVPTPFSQFGWYYDPKLKDQNAQEFNLDIQQQLTSGLMASVSYVGSLDKDLPITGIGNNSPNAGGAGLDRQFPWSGTALEATSRGKSNFNALEAKITKQSSHGLNFGSGFTWSKSMDNGSSGYYGVENGPQGYSTMQDYYHLDKNYGISGNSIKFIWYGYGLYELPFGAGRLHQLSGVADFIAGGWQANLNASAHSGVPLGFPDAAIDPSNIGNTSPFNYARANLSGNPKVSHPTAAHAFNNDPNAKLFSHPVNQFGNSGRGVLTAMPYDNFDFSLMKQFNVWESFNFKFRGEFFNVFNIQNYGAPGTTFGGGGFGQINSLAPGATPRQIQLSLRAEF